MNAHKLGSETFPNWNDAVRNPTHAFPWLNDATEAKTVRVTRVTHDGRVVPTVIMKCDQRAFRGEIRETTEARILMDVVTVLPFPTPLAYVMPIIFDDEDDPYWIHVFLNLFPVTGYQQLPVFGLDEEAHLASRAIIASFCQEPAFCGLIILDEQGERRKAEMLPFSPLQRKRLAEIAGILQFLERFTIGKDVTEYMLPQKLFVEWCAFPIQSPRGKGLVVPRGRSLKTASNLIYSIMVDHGRLHDRRAVLARPERPKFAFDLFISHAHLDNNMAHALSDWLQTIWPTLKISLTRAEDEEAFRANPAYFLEDSRRSRCILYLVTPNSLNRPMVDTELGGNAEKPIISLVTDGATLTQLKEKVEKDLFIAVDLDRAIAPSSQADWDRLLEVLSDGMQIPLPQSRVDPPDLSPIVNKGSSTPDLTHSYVEDCLRISESVGKRQTAKEANETLTTIVKELVTREGGDPERMTRILRTLPAQQKLVICLQAGNDETIWKNILEGFPALLDRSLLGHIDIVVNEAEGRKDVARAERLTRIRRLVEQVLEENDPG